MANSDKNIRITTSKNKITYPNIVFTGSAAGSSVITLEVLDDNTLSFTSNEGQVFSIDSNLSTGTIWAVSDISGIPLLSASAGGTIGLGVYGGLVAIGQTNPTYKLDLKGSFGLASSNDSLYNFIFSNSAASGSNSLQIRSANSLLLYNSGNTFYTGFKSNAATNITYTLPTTDGSSGQFLQTNGSAVLTWATATGSGGTGSTAGVGQGGQYEMAYYPGTGLSVVGSNTFTNNTATGVVSITHATVATDSSTGAFKVTGGVGIGGSLYVGGIGASITGVTFSNSTITRGTWNGTNISTTYGGTGQNLGSSSGVLTISSGTVSASTTSSAIASALSDETGSGSLVFNSQPSFGTGVITGDATFAVFNTNATTINAFGAATAISLGAATGKATFNSTDNSISSTTGGLVVSGGAGFAKSISVAGRLQLLNGANVTAFVSSGTGNTLYTLPATSPATGSSVLQSTAEGVMSWVPMVASSSSGAGSGTVAVPGAQYQIAAYYHSASGASVSGSTTFTNNTATGIVNINHSTVSISSATGALVVSGGVGIGGSIFSSTSVPSSISGVVLNNGIVTIGTWSGNFITSLYGGTGFNSYTIGDILVASTGTSLAKLPAGATNFVLTSNGTGTVPSWQAVPASAASSVAVSSTVVDAVFYPTVINSVSGSGLGLSTVNTIQINPARGTFAAVGISAGTAITVVGTAAAINTTTGALQVIGGVGIGGSLYAGGMSNFSSNTASISSGTGALVVTNGVGIGGSLNVASASSISGVIFNTNYLSATGGTFTTILQAATIRALSGNTISFQTIDGTNAAQINNVRVAVLYSTISTSSGTGALVVSGGAGIGGSLYVASASQFESSVASIGVGSGAVVVTGGVGIGGSINVGGASRFSSSTTATSVGTGALTVTGGAGIAGSLYVGEASRFTSSVASINSGTGALTVTGGVGIGGSLNVASPSEFEATTAAIDVGSGALVVTGGVGIGGSLFVGGASRFTSSTTSISTGTGALTVTGGVGIGGSLYVAGASRFSSSIAAISNGTGALTVTGGAGIGGSLYVGDVSRFESNINSITPGVGGLIATGGVGIGLSASIGGRLQMFNSSLYTAFVGAQSGVNTTYTLPTTSPATGSSVLQSTAGGVMSWVPMTSGGSASPGGVVDGSVQFKSGSSFGGTRGLYWNDLNKYLQVTGYAGGEPYASSQAALLIEQSYGSFNGSGNGNIIGANAVSGFTGSLIDLQLNAVTRFKVASTGAVTFANAFTFPTTDGSPNQVLQTNGSGSVSWATVTGSSGAGSGTVAIPNAQYAVAYYAGTGGSVSGSNTFTNNTSTGVVEITHTTESTSTTSGAFQVDGGAGIAKSLFVGTTLSVGTTPSYNVPNNLASFVSTVNSYNQLVIQNKSNGTSASANLVVNNDVSTDAANYGEIGMNSSTFSGSGALNAANAVYVAAHTAPLVLGTVTSHPIRFTVNNGATDTIYIHEAGTAISVFTNLDLRSQNDIRFFNSGNTFNTALQAGSNTVNYTLSLPTAPVGAGFSVIVTGSDGQMYFAAPGSGIAFSSATANTPLIRAKRPLNLQFAAGYTPLAAGPDNLVLTIPDNPLDGISKITYLLRDFYIRVETPSAGSSRIQLERSTGTGAFTLAATGSSYLAGFGLTLTGAGIYTTQTTSFAGAFLTSGDNLRLNWTLLNSTHANFSVQLLLEEV